MSIVELPKPAVLPVELIEKYIKLRDEKKAAEDQIKEVMAAKFIQPMEAIEQELMTCLNLMGVDSMKTAVGTAFRRAEVSVTVADQAAFSRHVIGNEAWNLIDFRANKTGVKAFVEETGGLLPPGINYTTTSVVSVRKPT